ncbi:ribosome-associated translation inhibitor RaiA [bacterium]|nr:ribosome-associated translation inhibitor RaiA [bacterium]
MEVRVHGIHMTVGRELTTLAEEKVIHAVRIFDDAVYADVEFTAEQNPRLSAERYRVQITSNVAGSMIRVESAEADDRAALEVAVDMYERQLRRHKERLIGRGRRSEKHLNAPTAVVEEQDDVELRIDRVKRFVVKPMSPEEAALQMELLGHSFFLFLNAESDTYSVLYRRRGGSLGLIEPQ